MGRISQLMNAASVAGEKTEEDNSCGYGWYYLKTNRLQPLGLHRGDKLLVETSDALGAGEIILIKLDNRLLLRRLEQGADGWVLVALEEPLASLTWPMHIPLPLVGIVKRVVREL